MSTFCVKNEVAIILHDESRVVTSAAGVGGPARVFVLAMVVRVIQNQISIALDDDVGVALMLVSVACP
jgi:hypothetical protein